MPPRRFSVESQTYCFLLKMGRSLIYHEQMNVEAVKAQMLEDIESLEYDTDGDQQIQMEILDFSE